MQQVGGGWEEYFPPTVGNVRFANVFFGVSPAWCACVVHHMQHREATQCCNQGRGKRGTIFQGPVRIGRAGRVGQVGEAGRLGRAGRAGEAEQARQVGVGLVNN